MGIFPSVTKYGLKYKLYSYYKYTRNGYKDVYHKLGIRTICISQQVKFKNLQVQKSPHCIQFILVKQVTKWKYLSEEVQTFGNQCVIED